MLYSNDHEEKRSVKAGWALVVVFYISGALFLWWLHEQVKPRELFAPHYEEPAEPVSTENDIS